MMLSHVIAMDPTESQESYFRRAAGTARYAYNWGLAEWNRQYEAGEKPSAAKIKVLWNAHRKAELPWTYEVTKCASGQAIIDLGAAFSNFFRDRKNKGANKSRRPQFKSKTADNGFALWNDQFKIEGRRIRIPGLGWVRTREELRFDGKLMGARVRRHGTRWFVSVHVETEVSTVRHGSGICGIDLGVSTLMTLSAPLADGSLKVENPKARRSLRKRQAKLQRRISRQETLRRRTDAETSRRQMIRRDRLRALHRRIVCIRKDAIHKATTSITSRFETIVLEDLNVSGMAKNHSLAGAVLDASFREIRRQIEYKMAMRCGRVIIVDRFFPSSKTCSDCGTVLAKLPLSKREWTCSDCGARHDRDINAARNLALVGAASPEPPAQLATRGEIEALASASAEVNPRSATRELSRDAIVRVQFRKQEGNG